MSPALSCHPTRVAPFLETLQPALLRPALEDASYWIWCGSPIQGEDKRFHLFAARWPRRLPFFESYPLYSEIIRADSDTPEGPYTMREVVLPDRGEGFWDGRMTHNPTILRYRNKFLLFYIGSTFPGERPSKEQFESGVTDLHWKSYPNIRIGLAIADSVYGPWTRQDKPILLPRPGKWDSTITTNPAPCIAPDGSILLYYRSNTPNGCRLGVSWAKNFDAPFERLSDEPILSFSEGRTLEDPFVWHNGDCFELIAKDLQGSFTGEYHAGVHAWSDNGVSWNLADPIKAYSRTLEWEDGSESTLGSLERPQLLFQNGKPSHLFAAAANGPGEFTKATKTWNIVIPLSQNSESNFKKQVGRRI